MNIQVYRSSICITVLFLIAILLSACGANDASNSNLMAVSDTQLTPTMHTAFQLTPASERMPDPIPVEGFGVYEVEGLGGSGQTGEQNKTGVLPSDEELDNSDDLLDSGGSSGGSLVAGKPADNANDLVANQVVVITPLPQSPSLAKPVGSANVAQSARPLPAVGTPVPAGAPGVSSAPSDGTATVAFTPTPICGGNQFHNVGPAHRVDKMPVDFDEFGSWMRSEDTYGAFLQTDLLSKSGPTAAWFCYFFNTPEDETAVFTQIRPVSGQPNTVRMWVYGNRSGHFLGVWILDRDHETWLIPLGPIIHEGWEEVEATFSGPNAVPVFYISGPSNQRIDYPILFRGVSLNDSPDAAITYGGVVIDEINFITK